jgi:hypothetical protein
VSQDHIAGKQRPTSARYHRLCVLVDDVLLFYAQHPRWEFVFQPKYART